LAGGHTVKETLRASPDLCTPLHREQPENGEQNVDVAPPWKNICGRPWL